MSWLGNGFREEARSLSDAYAQMYAQPEEVEQEELSEGEKKEGKKDACYHKVKSRYDVWPSAYASGALVKCRAKGAANWGNSSKKESFELALGELVQEGESFAGISEEDAWDAFLFGWEEGEQLNEKACDKKKKGVKIMDEVEVLASMADAYNMVYEKKSKKKDSDKCGEDTYWDSDEKKCKSKNKSSGRRGGVIIGGYPGYGGGGSNGGGDNGGDGETDGGDGGDGGGGGE